MIGFPRRASQGWAAAILNMKCVAESRRSPVRQHRSPCQDADAQLALEIISKREFTRRQDKIYLTECSWRWGDDIWNGEDRDYRGLPTGSGKGKRRCGQCGRKTPPQDLVKCRPPKSSKSNKAPATKPIRICTDCRTIAPPPPRISGPSEILRSVAVMPAESLEGIPPELMNDGSPMGDALDGLAAEGSMEEMRLPDEDLEALAAGIEQFKKTGDLKDFQGATGDRDIQ